MVISATDFLRQGDPAGQEKSIPVAGFMVSLADASVGILNGNQKPVSLIQLPTPLSPEPMRLLSAPAGQGMGTFSLLPSFSLSIPPSTYAGNYLSVVTAVAVAGP